MIKLCCRSSCYPLVPDIAAAILEIGQFHLITTPSNVAPTWQRRILEEGCIVSVTLSGGAFEASISPSISNMDHHIGKRITAGVYFEVLAKYAEKVGGEIIQKATVLGCKAPAQSSGLVVARYPSIPMTYERVCPGFQSVLLPPLEEIA